MVLYFEDPLNEIVAICVSDLDPGVGVFYPLDLGSGIQNPDPG
jgi:hypothetical protein